MSFSLIGNIFTYFFVFITDSWFTSSWRGRVNNFHKDSTRRIPASTSFNMVASMLPIFSVKKDLSTVINCETLTTDFFGNPDSFFDKRILPGASASRRLEVITTAITVFIRL